MRYEKMGEGYADKGKRKSYLEEMKGKYSDEEAGKIKENLEKIDALSKADNKYEDSVHELAFFEKKEREKEESDFIEQFPEFNPEEENISEEEKEKRKKIIHRHTSRIGNKLSGEKLKELELDKKRYTDNLTGLKNKNAFLKDMPDIISMEIREEKPFSLILIDIDKFKNLNDTYGHLAGDDVLHSVAENIKRSVREKPYVYRYGGEEIAVLVIDCDDKKALEVANHIRSKIEKLSVKTKNKEGREVEIKTTISLGCVSSGSVHDYRKIREEIKKRVDKGRDFDGEFQEKLQEKLKYITRRLIEKADSALYRSKDEGRNRATIFKREKIEVL